MINVVFKKIYINVIESSNCWTGFKLCLTVSQVTFANVCYWFHSAQTLPRGWDVTVIALLQSDL